jgi:hypothetical protein
MLVVAGLPVRVVAHGILGLREGKNPDRGRGHGSGLSFRRDNDDYGKFWYRYLYAAMNGTVLAGWLISRLFLGYLTFCACNARNAGTGSIP